MELSRTEARNLKARQKKAERIILQVNIIRDMQKGMSNRKIAAKYGISESSVRRHLK